MRIGNANFDNLKPDKAATHYGKYVDDIEYCFGKLGDNDGMTFIVKYIRFFKVLFRFYHQKTGYKYAHTSK